MTRWTFSARARSESSISAILSSTAVASSTLPLLAALTSLARSFIALFSSSVKAGAALAAEARWAVVLRAVAMVAVSSVGRVGNDSHARRGRLPLASRILIDRSAGHRVRAVRQNGRDETEHVAIGIEEGPDPPP